METLNEEFNKKIVLTLTTVFIHMTSNFEYTLIPIASTLLYVINVLIELNFTAVGALFFKKYVPSCLK